MEGRVLVVDDDESMCEMVNGTLLREGWAVKSCATAEQALRRVDSDEIDVVVTDLKLAGLSGLDLCQRLVSERPDVPVVVMTAFGSMDTAVAALRVGAYDFISKPFDIDALSHSVSRAMQHRRLSSEVRSLRAKVEHVDHLDEMIGESPAMKRVYDLIARVASTDSTVLLTGDSGTGKELAARAIHRRSARAEGPFVAINCAAMPPPLLESELFGHVRGAFTDARRTREGLFVRANRGTLFLDEIGEMSLEMQPKLLRALQEGRVRPVGGSTEVPVDTRIIAATNQDLDRLVEQGKFREDLYYRIAVVPLKMPPLKDRANDVLLLAQRYLQDFAERVHKPVCGFSRGAAQRLLDYDWPGNVRELKNCIERAVALTQYEEIAVEDLPSKVRTHPVPPPVVTQTQREFLPTLEDVERSYVRRVLDAVGGNKAQAAKVLGLHRRTLYRKLARYEIAEA